LPVAKYVANSNYLIAPVPAALDLPHITTPSARSSSALPAFPFTAVDDPPTFQFNVKLLEHLLNKQDIHSIFPFKNSIEKPFPDQVTATPEVAGMAVASL